MSTSFFSLIFVGVVGVGTFAGTLQQNLAHPQAPEIDRLFHEIEKDIRDFSNRNPLTKIESDSIKNPPTSSGEDTPSRRKRNATDSDVKESKNTLSIWTDLWVGLISDYVKCLKVICNQKFTEKILDKNKENAIKFADNQNQDEKVRFENKLNNKKQEIEKIYQKIKTFVLKIEIPKEYEYHSSGQQDCPYENYINKILINN